jgi:hypothetical protein
MNKIIFNLISIYITILLGGIMQSLQSYSLNVSVEDLINRSFTYSESNSYVAYNWQVGQISEINSMKFIPLLAAKCINYQSESNDEYDLIRVDEIYPVIMIFNNELGIDTKYLIINRKGRKQYWSLADFQIVDKPITKNL